MSGRYHLFDAVGIELEYMIVDRDTLDVRPIADRLFEAQTGAITGDVEFDDGIGWSNELVAHVVELKTATPAASLDGLSERFHQHVRRINELLGPMNAMLMPTAMHPWMDPFRETRLWPHDNHEIYEAFNRIFDCRGHGWSNLQSMHINLPFAGDEEFARLHAAIRLVLPILPALAASSPIVDGRVTGTLDNRLAVYKTNSARIPSVTARVIPEPVFDRAAYHAHIFERIWADLSPFDPRGLLRDEFANARGAIARFGRGSIEIRVIDVQECPAMDLAIASLVVGVIRALAGERWSTLREQRAWPVEPLADIFDGCVVSGDRYEVTDHAYLAAFGLGAGPITADDLWRRLAEAIGHPAPAPPAARRIIDSLPATPTRADLATLYRELCECLASNRPFGVTAGAEHRRTIAAPREG